MLSRVFLFFKQKTAYEVRISDWSSDVCSSDLDALVNRLVESDAGATAPKVGELMPEFLLPDEQGRLVRLNDLLGEGPVAIVFNRGQWCPYCRINVDALARAEEEVATEHRPIAAIVPDRQKFAMWLKSDAKALFQHTSELQSLMRLSYAVFCLKKKKNKSSK